MFTIIISNQTHYSSPSNIAREVLEGRVQGEVYHALTSTDALNCIENYVDRHSINKETEIKAMKQEAARLGFDILPRQSTTVPQSFEDLGITELVSSARDTSHDLDIEITAKHQNGQDPTPYQMQRIIHYGNTMREEFSNSFVSIRTPNDPVPVLGLAHEYEEPRVDGDTETTVAHSHDLTIDILVSHKDGKALTPYQYSRLRHYRDRMEAEFSNSDVWLTSPKTHDLIKPNRECGSENYPVDAMEPEQGWLVEDWSVRGKRHDRETPRFMTVTISLDDREHTFGMNVDPIDEVETIHFPAGMLDAFRNQFPDMEIGDNPPGIVIPGRQDATLNSAGHPECSNAGKCDFEPILISNGLGNVAFCRPCGRRI